MSHLVLKIGVLCWSFVMIFVAFLLLAMAIPSGAILYVSLLLGFLILAGLGSYLRKLYRTEGFDLGWFLAVKKGYWSILVGAFGLFLLAIGFFGLVFPQFSNEIGEKHAMKAAYLLAILFWTALTLSFLSWSLACFSEAVAIRKTGNSRSAFGSFSLGIVWLLFANLFLSLFLEMINDNFFPLTATTQNYILGVFAVLSVILGLLSGASEKPKKSEQEET